MILKQSRISVGPQTAKLSPCCVLVLSPMSFSCATPARVRRLLSDVPCGANGDHSPKGAPVVRLVLKERLLSPLEYGIDPAKKKEPGKFTRMRWDFFRTSAHPAPGRSS